MSHNKNFHSFNKDQGNPSKDENRRNVHQNNNYKNQNKSNHYPFPNARENQQNLNQQPASQTPRSYNTPMSHNQLITPTYSPTHNDKNPRVVRGRPNQNQNRNYPYHQQPNNYYQPQYAQKGYQSPDLTYNAYDLYIPQYPNTYSLFPSSVAAISTQLNEHQREITYPPFHVPPPVPYTLSSSKSVHPFEYFLSQSAERKLEMFLNYRKKIAHHCKDICSLGVCDSCCNELKMPCQKHKHVLSDVSLDMSQQLTGPVLNAIADWFVTADIDLSITKRASKPIPTTTQNGTIQVDFSFSLLCNPSSENLRVYFFQLETPIVSLVWETDYDVNKKIYHPPAGKIPIKGVRLLCVVYAVTDTSITTQYERLLSSQKTNTSSLFVPNTPTEVSFFCPGTSKKFELPGRSTKCQHAQCVDMKNYFEHNRLNCKESVCNWCFWLCFVCKQRINIVDFKVDTVMLSILATVTHDANARAALIHANNGCTILYHNDEAYLKPRLSHRDTKSQISQYFANDDVEIGQLKLGLKCTITLARIAVPCRSLKCNHLQCFDFSGFVQYNKVMKKIQDPKEWKCPLCSGSAGIEEVYVDMFVKSILEQAPSNVDSVELFKDGTWKVSAETIKKSSNVVDLTLDDEEVEITYVSESMFSNFLSPVKDVISKLYSLNSITELSSFYKSVKAKQYFLQIGAQIEKSLKSNKFTNPDEIETKLWNSIKCGLSGDMNCQLYRFWSTSASNANNTNLAVVKRLKEMFPSIPEFFLIPIYEKNNNDFNASVQDIMSFSEVAMVVNEPPKPPVVTTPVINNTNIEIPLLQSMPNDAVELLRRQLEVATKQNEMLNQEVQKYKDRLYCCVCYENEINVILFPCNHQCMCSVCAPKVNDCPICKTSIEYRSPVYTSR